MDTFDAPINPDFMMPTQALSGTVNVEEVMTHLKALSCQQAIREVWALFEAMPTLGLLTKDSTFGSRGVLGSRDEEGDRSALSREEHQRVTETLARIPERLPMTESFLRYFFREPVSRKAFWLCAEEAYDKVFGAGSFREVRALAEQEQFKALPEARKPPTPGKRL
jgi:hypothetical protein